MRSTALDTARAVAWLDFDGRHSRASLERMLLGAILEGAEADVYPRDFFYPWNAETLRALQAAGDLEHLFDHLDERLLNMAGGLPYLADCMNAARHDLVPELVAEIKKCPRCER